MKGFGHKGQKLNNKGTALLTVILVVAFLTILATTLLYVSGMNFVIKQADYQNKKNFYSGETALEEIRAYMMQNIVSVAGAEAFYQVNMNFIQAGSSDVRQYLYYEYFTDEVEEMLKDKITAYTDWAAYLSTMYTTNTYTTLTMQNPSYTNDPSAGGVSLGDTVEITSDKGLVSIKGIEVTYINKDGLATKISTDLELYAPDVSWDADASAMSLTLADGTAVDENTAKVKNKVDVSRCVIYTNWKKE